jgi:hypothetical protein
MTATNRLADGDVARYAKRWDLSVRAIVLNRLAAGRTLLARASATTTIFGDAGGRTRRG